MKVWFCDEARVVTANLENGLESNILKEIAFPSSLKKKKKKKKEN